MRLAARTAVDPAVSSAMATTATATTDVIT
jgi:hypothetical protein